MIEGNRWGRINLIRVYFRVLELVDHPERSQP